MKTSTKLFALCAFVAGLAGFGPAMAQDGTLAGDKVCTQCHDENWPKPVLSYYQTKHGTKADSRTPGCQTCHGASQAHVKASGGTPPDRTFGKNSQNTPAERSETCMSCHKRDSNRSHWEGSTHQLRDITCANCHTVHAPKDPVLTKLTQPQVCFTCHKQQRSEINRPSRHPILEGKVACSDCHNPHGSVGPSLMKRNSVVETCYQCHAEKRGPFVHEHEPVQEDCTNCHNPHGTVAENLLKIRPPMLCHQCHTPHGGQVLQLTGQLPLQTSATSSGKNGINYTQGRGCVNCHSQIHGSNNPAFTNPTVQFFLR